MAGDKLEMKQKLILEQHRKGNDGFTLLEILVALVISLLVSAAVYAAYTAQHKSYIVQEQVVEMQQNLRAAFETVAAEARMAVYDPYNTAQFNVLACQPGQLSITADLNEDKIFTPNEQIDFGFSTVEDNDRNGLPDTAGSVGTFGIQKGGGGGYQPLANNIEAIEFSCLDKAGNVTTDLNKVNVVLVTMLARSSRQDPEYTNRNTYTAASGATLWTGATAGDNFRRRMLISSLLLRNEGL